MPETFTCHWLNRLDQFDSTDIELVVTHDQGIIPERRQWMNYCGISLTESFLGEESKRVVDQMISEYDSLPPE